MNHSLLRQLTENGADPDEISELYSDLQFIFDNPFGAAIDHAVVTRGCVYIENLEQRAN